MKSRDVALSAFDPVADAIRVDETAADELFAVADLLEGQPPLRRSLSDPSASGRDRQALARRLFEGRLGAAALSVVTEVAHRPWPSGRTMIDAIERQGVRGLLRTANERGELKRVQEELHRFALVIDGSPELSDALRNRGRALADRRALIARLPARSRSPSPAIWLWPQTWRGSGWRGSPWPAPSTRGAPNGFAGPWRLRLAVPSSCRSRWTRA